MFIYFCFRRSTFNCFLFVMVTKFPVIWSVAFWLADILSSTTRVTGSVNKQKALATSDTWLVENFPFRQEGCRAFSLLKYFWSKVLRFRHLVSLAVILFLNAMDPKVAKLLEGKTDQEKFQAIAFSFRCLLTRPTINSNVDAPMKGKTANIYSIRGCVFTVAFSVARLNAKCCCSFVDRWSQGEEEGAQWTEIFLRRIERRGRKLR